MGIIKRLLAKLGKWEYTCLCILVVFSLAVHFSIIAQPPQPIFDEEYYVTDAKLILEEHTTDRTEHPPLGKLFVAASIAVLGDNPFGWRTLPIILGTANIALFYFICRRLHMSRRAANLGAFLLALENLSFVQSSIAMLDVFSVFFMLLSFWLYLRYSYPLAAVAVALAALAKLTGVFAGLVILLHWLIARRQHGRVNFIASMSLAPLSFLLLMPALEFIIYYRLTDFVSSIRTMLTQSASLTFASASHPYFSRPWEWILLPKIMPYYYGPHYFGAVSFTVWALIVPAVVYMTFRALKGNHAGLFGIAWFAGTYLVWIPLSLITNRVSFIFYFYPTIGAICIGLGMGLSQLVDFWKSRAIGKLRWAALVGVVIFLLLHLGIFIALTPVNPWPVENLVL